MHIKDPVVPVRFGRLWKHQNNPACTESVRIFETLKMDAIQKKESILHTYTLLMFDQTGGLKMITSGLFYGCKLYNYVTVSVMSSCFFVFSQWGKW